MTFNTITFPRMAMLSTAQCEAIHRASLEILRRTGVRIHHAAALDLLRDTEALITDQQHPPGAAPHALVRFPPALVEWAIAQAPSRIALCRRGSDEVVASLEGHAVNFGPGSDCPNYLDPRTGEHRPFRLADVIDCIHVVDALPQLQFCMSMGIPADLGQANPYRQQFALMVQHTTKPIVFVCDDRADCEAIAAMAAAAAGGMDELRLNPTLLLYSEPSTPLQHSDTATGKLLYMAEKALPIVHSPAPMMGGTAPVTMAGGLALGNAETLSSLVLHQLKRPGAPFVYGSGLHHMDMKTTISVYGAPEFQLARVAVAEMGRFYGLPTWGYAGHSDSCAMDEQAAADATFSVLVALLAGNNLVHDVGYLEAGLTTSPEMMVFTAEAIDMMRRFTSGISLDPDALALDVIDAVGPGGDFLTQRHTLKNFRQLWQPALFDRRRYEEWAAAGSKTLGARLKEKTIDIIDSHRPQPLPDSVLAEIEQIVARET
ncbi:MAG: trimethylamine methyltransferase family protein [Anaerolineae bacterium]|nr:trimethylamine methyltransferase family protein [Anaerolineae bacterium]